MKILSVQIGKTQTYNYKNEVIKTAFCKQPTQQKIKVHFLGLDGDEQTNKKYHGGITKAIYAYDQSNYNHWKKVMPNYNFEAGNFGENLLTQGLKDEEAFIGNIYKMGTALIQVIEPRFPCSRLNFRFNNSKMVKLFTAQAFFGIYFKVIEEGFIQANDEIILYEQSKSKVSIKDIANQFVAKQKDVEMIQHILNETLLPQSVKNKFLPKQ